MAACRCLALLVTCVLSAARSTCPAPSPRPACSAKDSIGGGDKSNHGRKKQLMGHVRCTAGPEGKRLRWGPALLQGPRMPVLHAARCSP